MMNMNMNMGMNNMNMNQGLLNMNQIYLQISQLMAQAMININQIMTNMNQLMTNMNQMNQLINSVKGNQPNNGLNNINFMMNNMNNLNEPIYNAFIIFENGSLNPRKFSISCNKKDKLKDVIEKYRIKSGDRSSTKFIFSAKIVNLEKTIEENGLRNGDTILVLDEKRVYEGIKIYNYRKKYIDLINENINKIFKNYIKNQLIRIDYESDYKLNDKEILIKELKRNRKKEINLGMTDFGIHRDDYVFCQNENNCKEFSSQGIQKLIILAMKLSEVNIFINNYDIKPILLLDDLFSELDMKNRNNIFKSLDKKIQIFITTTDLKNIDKKIIEKAKIFNLDEKVK